MMKTGKDIVTGIYWTKTSNPAPVIFEKMGAGPMFNFEPGKVIPVGGSGLGCCLINMKVFDKFDELGTPYFVENWIYTDESGNRMKCPVGEDHYFFLKAKEMGYQAWCHTSVMCDHYDVEANKFYPGEKIVREYCEKSLHSTGEDSKVNEYKKSLKDPTKKTVVIYNDSVPFSGDEDRRRGIGGSEHDIIELAKCWQRSGKYDVKVYPKCLREGIFENVVYRDNSKMLPELTDAPCDVFISSRNITPFTDEIGIRKLAKTTILWAHDLAMDMHWIGFNEDMMKNIDFVVALSNFHKENIAAKFPFIPEEKWLIFRNGVDPMRYKDRLLVDKVPGKCIYSSTPYRGLDVILRVWPRVKSKVPHANLHVFSSIKVYSENFDDSPWETIYHELKRTPGIYYHGTVKHDRLSKEQMESELLFYPNTFEETCCLVGDTKIAIPGGTKLLKDIEKGDIVYGYSSETNQLSFGKVLNKKLTRTNTEVYKVNYKWGIGINAKKEGYIIGTGDHLVLMKNGTYKRIDELKENDSVMPFYRRKSGKYITLNLNNGKSIYEHDFISQELMNYNPIKGKKIVHHIDGNGCNNLPNNLSCLDQSIHAKNHIDNLSIETKHERNLKISGSLKEMLKNPVKIKIWSEASKERWENMTDDERTRFLEHRKIASTLEVIAKRTKKIIELNAIRKIKIDKDILEQKYIIERESMNQISKELNVSDNVICRNLEEYGFHIRGRHEAQLALQNHKILSVEPCGNADVYDLEVDKIHNFVANDIIVHNCVTAMENQHAGTPILSSVKGALPEMVPDECGTLIAGDPYSQEYQDAFVEQAIDILTNKDRWQKMHDACVTKDYSWESISREWTKVFEGTHKPVSAIESEYDERTQVFKKDLKTNYFRVDGKRFEHILTHWGKLADKIMDVNCGLGEFPRFLRRSNKDAEIWGTEESMWALDYCRKKDKTIFHANHPIENPEFEKDYFELITVIHHYKLTSDLLSKLIGLLRKDGRLIVVVGENDMKKLQDLVTPFDVMVELRKVSGTVIPELMAVITKNI
jgi:glycosyltransferase involved in cell wall biosynthesis